MIHHLALSKNRAIDFGTMSALEAALADAEQADSFILTGGATVFALGGDLKAFSTLLSKEEGLGMARRMDAILRRIETLPVPTMAVVNGAAYGGGVEILGAFDRVIAVEDAVFGFTQKRFGLPPGWGGLTRLGRRVEEGLLREWFEEMRVVSAQEALRAGLVDGVLDGEEFFNREEWRKGDGSIWGHELDLAQIEARIGGRMQYARIDAEIERFSEAWASEEHHSKVKDFLSQSS